MTAKTAPTLSPATRARIREAIRAQVAKHEAELAHRAHIRKMLGVPEPAPTAPTPELDRAR